MVAGVDSSTQSTKVELRDADTGRLLARGQAPHPAADPPRSEQDPEAWWRALAGALAACATAGADPGEVAAISVAAQQHGLVLTAADGSVLRPAKLWNDTESAPDAARLVTALGGPGAWAAACGTVPVAAITITKLAWVHRCEPETLARTAHVLLPHDWLTWRLAGEHVTDRGDASGTGYWSPSEGRWRGDLLALVDPDRDWTPLLPRVRGPGGAAGTVQETAAAALGLAVGATVACGTGDNMGAALGLGLTPGDVAVSLGTSGTVYAVSEHPTADPSGLVAGFADATGRFLPLVCTLNATRVTDAVARLLGVDVPALDRAAVATAPGAGGLVLLPYFDGERTPNRPDATGVVVGLRSDTQPGHVARAAVEGVVCGQLDGLDALRAAGVPVDGGQLLLIGGGARSPAFRQVLADLAGRPVTVPVEAELVAAGAAVQAAAALHGAHPDEIAAAWRLGSGDVVEPTPDGVDAAPTVRAAYAAVRDGAR